MVIKKSAFEGHYVKAGDHQYEIADLSKVWVDVDIYEYELSWVRKGMQARMDLPYNPGEQYRGEVLFIYPYLDAKTRTARLRLAFDNRDGRLKPGMYATIYLESALPEETLTIPHEAVIDSGVRQIVFIARDKGKFQPQEVRLGLEGDNYEVQVLSGLSEGDRIVVSGQFMLDSESRLNEAIQKMLKARHAEGASGDEDPDLELDMEGMTMDDDLDMEHLNMDDAPPEKTGSSEK